MKKLTQLTIPPTTGNKLISEQTDLFSYIDSDFKNWGANEKGNPTTEMSLAVCEMTEDATFKQLFTNPDKMALTQDQIISFVEYHKDQLRTDGHSTFFLFKSGEQFFVAYLYFYDDFSLLVDVLRFRYDDVWLAECRHRVVIPADSLDALPYDTVELGTLESLTATQEVETPIKEAIRLLKKHGFKITRRETIEKEY